MRIVSLILSVLALAVSVLAAYYTGQQVRVAKKTAQQQLRAYVFIRDGGVILNEKASGAQAVIQVQNYGQTPGYDFQSWTGIAVGDTRDDPYSKLVEEPKQKSIIGPSADFNVPSEAVTLTPEQMSAIRSRHAAIFVWGRIRYRDAFKRCWEFVFRDRVTGPEDLKVAGKSVGWGLAPDPRYGYSEKRRRCLKA
jgi:hypothetical protein